MKDDTALVHRLYTDIEWALTQGLPQVELVAMLERLGRQAEAGSPHYVYAKRQLAELLVRTQPFRAARVAQDVLSVQPDDRAYSVLGLAHMILGNYRLAESAYRKALAMTPHCPWYAHNLGHLLDVALARSLEALPLLRLALKALPHEPEIRSSYAHALLGAGQKPEARQQLLAAVSGDAEKAERIWQRWTS